MRANMVLSYETMVANTTAYVALIRMPICMKLYGN